LASRLREACDAPDATLKWGDESRAWASAQANSTESAEHQLGIISGLSMMPRYEEPYALRYFPSSNEC
jgi:hypothetical protein